VAVVAVAVMVIVCGRHGLWPSLSNPVQVSHWCERLPLWS